MDRSKINSPRISSPTAELKPRYDVVVVGSGCGGSIAACRIASAGKSVCLLEKGKEWLPDEFSETATDSQWDVHMHHGGQNFATGRSYNFYGA